MVRMALCHLCSFKRLTQCQLQQRPATANTDTISTPSPSLKDSPLKDSSAQPFWNTEARRQVSSSDITATSPKADSEKLARLRIGNLGHETSAKLHWPIQGESEFSESPTHMAMPDLSTNSSPSANLMDLSGPTAPMNPQSSHVRPETTGTELEFPLQETFVSTSTAFDGPYSAPIGLPIPTACLCDPTCLRIVESFQDAQLRPADIPLDRLLLLLRCGVTMCEQSLKCALCMQRTPLLASLLLMHGAMTGYSSLLASQNGTSNGGSNGNRSVFGVTIGDFEVDDSLQSQVVSEVVKTEMGRGIKVLKAFEKATQNSNSSARMSQAINHLSRALLEDFSFPNDKMF